MLNSFHYADAQFWFVKNLLALICAAIMLFGLPPASAQDGVQPMPEPSPMPLIHNGRVVTQERNADMIEDAIKLTPEERLNKLFDELLKTSNEVKARRIAAQISNIWAQSGSATVDLLLVWSYEAMQQKKYAVAIDFLDEAIALAPDNPESWNRRAALHVLNNEYSRAIYDINRVLELEPRHFGALVGLAGILQETGRKATALKVYERVLALYPMMREAQLQVQLLSEELSDIHT